MPADRFPYVLDALPAGADSLRHLPGGVLSRDLDDDGREDFDEDEFGFGDLSRLSSGRVRVSGDYKKLRNAFLVEVFDTLNMFTGNYHFTESLLGNLNIGHRSWFDEHPGKVLDVFTFGNLPREHYKMIDTSYMVARKLDGMVHYEALAMHDRAVMPDLPHDLSILASSAVALKNACRCWKSFDWGEDSRKIRDAVYMAPEELSALGRVHGLDAAVSAVLFDGVKVEDVCAGGAHDDKAARRNQLW